jgi:hypothetical protein
MAMTGKCTDSTNQQIIEEMVGSAPELVLNLDNQIAQIIERKEKVEEQIAVLETCVEDYLSNKLQAILYGLGHAYNTYALGNYERFIGEWKIDTGYPYLTATHRNFVSLTDKDDPFVYKYYRCLQNHVSDTTNKPPNSSYWEEYDIIINPSEDGQYNVEFTLPSKEYGASLLDWHIDKWVEEVTLDPDPAVPPVYTMTYISVYSYNAGITWGLQPDIDADVISCVEGWGSTNDLVTKPMTEPLNPVESASYGLKAIRDALEKAQTYLTNNKNKIIAMVPILGNFIK